MLLTESYKIRLKELAGIKKTAEISILKEVEDLYTNSEKRIKFDKNVMKQAIEGGMEVGMVFQSNNAKYKMPTWKYRVIQPVAMGYDKHGNLVIRGIHIVGQSEKKAIETGIRSAEAKNEWRLFKVENIKSIFLTGRFFSSISLPGYKPNDSAMASIIAKFNPTKAASYQKKLKIQKPAPEAPVAPVEPAIKKPAVNPVNTKEKQNTQNLEKKIDKLNKLL